MRRIAFACLCLTLSGCGYNTWWNPPFSSGNNPNMPAGESENMRRVVGEQVNAKPLTPEPGDIWPGPLPPEPTLQELEQQGEQGGTEQPVPGSPDFRSGTTPPSSTPPYQPPPPPARGSSTPPVSNQPPLRPLPAPTPPPADQHQSTGAESRRPGVPDAAGPGRDERRGQRLSDDARHLAAVRPSSCPMAMARARSYIQMAPSRRCQPHAELPWLMSKRR